MSAEKRVLVTGGTGFLGVPLVLLLARSGYCVEVMSRRSSLPKSLGLVENVTLFTEASGDPLPEIVINLAGEGIADKRWSESRKLVLQESRINVTRRLVELYKARGQAPERVISGSAIGYYGFSNELVGFEESAAAGAGFAAQLCRQWEEAALLFEALGTKVCCVRIGVVIGWGGMIKRLYRPFFLGLGGVIGRGDQLMSWISLTDVIEIIRGLLSAEEIPKVVNAVAPDAVSNRELTRCIGKELDRWTPFPMPEILVKTIFGQMGEELLLGGQRVIPGVLENEGYNYQYPGINGAIKAALYDRE